MLVTINKYFLRVDVERNYTISKNNVQFRQSLCFNRHNRHIFDMLTVALGKMRLYEEERGLWRGRYAVFADVITHGLHVRYCAAYIPCVLIKSAEAYNERTFEYGFTH